MAAVDTPTIHAAELVPLDELKPHPSNYREHPDDQRRHLSASLAEHGLYRNVIAAQDGTILAGHGVVEAARAAGLDRIPVVRLPIAPDDPRALKVLTGDNELGRIAMVDDRLLAELLREIRDSAELLGTGYDDAMLANLVFVTRAEHEIGNRDDAASWVGLPEFVPTVEPFRVVVSCDTAADRDALLATLGIETIHKHTRGVFSVWWPPRGTQPLEAFRFDDDPEPAEVALDG